MPKPGSNKKLNKPIYRNDLRLVLHNNIKLLSYGYL